MTTTASRRALAIAALAVAAARVVDELSAISAAAHPADPDEQPPGIEASSVLVLSDDNGDRTTVAELTIWTDDLTGKAAIRVDHADGRCQLIPAPSDVVRRLFAAVLGDPA